MTDGTVSAVAASGNTVYLGGSFKIVGPAIGGAALLDSLTGAPQAPYAGVVGQVNVVVADGAGGWYIGGSFSSVQGQARLNLARILADGSLGSWNPTTNDTVKALVLYGNTVYAGGDFAFIGGQARNRIAALDGSTGLATAWNPDASGSVNALEVTWSTVYAGGAFTTIGGGASPNFAMLSVVSGTLVAGSPNTPDGPVMALASSGSTMYLGGSFANMLPRTGATAALDNVSGAPRAPYAGVAGQVNAAVPDGAGGWYIGGLFTSVQGQARANLAHILADGRLDSWNPGTNSTVRALAVSGSTLYAGGVFTTIGGQARNFIAAVDAASGLATAWNPSADQTVTALAVSGFTLYVGGTFSTVGGQARNRIAAVNTLTGLATPWNPNANNYYGAYSSRRRGWWRRRGVVLAGAGHEQAHDDTEPEVAPWPALKARRRRWAELLRLVFAVDVEVCPKCGGEMRIIAFVMEHAVVTRILAHLERRGVDARAGPWAGVATG